MKLIRWSFLALFLVSTVMYSCQNETANSSSSKPSIDSLSIDTVTIDSDAIVLSLTPTVGNLPLYYAQQDGIFKTLGLKVCLKTFASQFDCDTAMLGRTAIGGTTDLLRVHYYTNVGKPLAVATSLDEHWCLLSASTLRIKRIPSLANRMISVARFSSSDYYGEQALLANKMDYADVFHPQINDYELRTSMLRNHQIDAAILPEPFATKAKLKGHHLLYSTQKESLRMGCLAFKPTVMANADSLALVKLILEGYNQAVEALNKKGKKICRKILYNEYHLKGSVVDSLQLPHYQPASLPKAIEMEEAKRFLKNQNRWNGEHSDKIIANSSSLYK